jgi:heme/copper-type cytochrome/quinol oxidase subunit 4
MNIPIMISPIQIILFLITFILLTGTALIMASKKETNFQFLIWTLIIIFLPFFGSLSYILKFYTSRKINNNVA